MESRRCKEKIISATSEFMRLKLEMLEQEKVTVRFRVRVIVIGF